MSVNVKRSRKIADNFNRLSRVHKRYRRQTDDRRNGDSSEREREFTFAKSGICSMTTRRQVRD